MGWQGQKQREVVDLTLSDMTRIEACHVNLHGINGRKTIGSFAWGSLTQGGDGSMSLALQFRIWRGLEDHVHHVGIIPGSVP